MTSPAVFSGWVVDYSIIVKDMDKSTTNGPLVWSMSKMCWEFIKRMEESVVFAEYTKATKSNIFGYVKF
jgi:hypothetical protein